MRSWSGSPLTPALRSTNSAAFKARAQVGGRHALFLELCPPPLERRPEPVLLPDLVELDTEFRFRGIERRHDIDTDIEGAAEACCLGTAIDRQLACIQRLG